MPTRRRPTDAWGAASTEEGRPSGDGGVRGTDIRTSDSPTRAIPVEGAAGGGVGVEEERRPIRSRGA